MAEYTNAERQINEWFSKSPESVRLVKNMTDDGDSMALLRVNRGSYLGEIVGRYSKATFCNGLLCLLCGNGDFSIVDINALDKNGIPQLFPGALIIAYDKTGGVFALNSGASKNARMGSVLFLPKESFVWESLDINYAQFLKWISSVSENDLVDNGWIPEKKEKPVEDILEFLLGKAAAYNLFLRQAGE